MFPIFHILRTTNKICAEKCEDCAGGAEVVLCRSVGDDQVKVDGDEHDGDDDHHHYHEADDDHHEAVADDIVQGRVGRSGQTARGGEERWNVQSDDTWRSSS